VRSVGPDVRSTVVVVTWRGRPHVGRCLDALAGQRPHQILVVDNHSTDGTAEILADHSTRPRVLRLPANRGYAGGLAAALPLVRTTYVAWLNDDAEPEPGWLAALEDALDADPAAAAAGSTLINGDGSVSSAGVRLTGRGYGADLRHAGPTFGFCGGAVLLRTAALAAVGGVPAGFFCYYEDTDTAWRLRLAGWALLQTPAARARHALGASSAPGSAAFHRWNERNRLWMLLRCAPARVALRELAAFAALTAVLPARRSRPRTPNFTVALRLRVLVEVLAGLPAALTARFRIGRTIKNPRAAVWRTWSGRPQPGRAG
jgi:GT2 family glycosyltransferase